MDIKQLLNTLEASAPAAAIRESIVLFPLIEAVHVIGLALVFGTIMIVDLRILGLASKQRVYRIVASELLKWTWASFAITVVTGVLMFITNPDTYFENVFFRAKMIMLALAGVNMMIFQFTTSGTMERWDDPRPSPSAAKIAATLSLCLWIGVIATGRMIGFSISGGAKEPEPPPPEMDFEDFLSSVEPGDAAPAQTVVRLG